MNNGARWAAVAVAGLGLAVTIVVSVVGATWSMSRTFVTLEQYERDLETMRRRDSDLLQNHDHDLDRIEEHLREIRNDVKAILRNQGGGG